MRIIIYHTGALGDFITVLPLLRVLRRRHAPAWFVFLGRRIHGQLGQQSGYFDEVWDVEERRFGTIFAENQTNQFPQEFMSIDGAVVFASDDSPVIRFFSGLPLRFFLHQPPFPSVPIHVVDYHLSLLDETPHDERDRRPHLELDVAASCLPPLPQFSVVLHPGSGSLKKNWPFRSFERLAEKLSADGFHPVWLVGPVEEERGPNPSPDYQRVVRSPPLYELAVLLSQSSLYVGNDSGVSHLAAAVGCPTVVLFGPTDPRVWAPRGQCVVVVRSVTGQMETIGLDEVWKACLEAIRVCNRRISA